MVVVEGAKGRLGERLPVVITGALQNPTGRIVFARLEPRPPQERRGERTTGKPR